MVTGVGIIGALASILARMLVGASSSGTAPDSGTPAINEELAAVKSELALLRSAIDEIDGRLAGRDTRWSGVGVVTRRSREGIGG
jgi:hypothetical protein